MNYGEALGYWYLRFNGFFPFTRFVLHRSSTIDYTSDCDLLAVRPPHVFEEIGGQGDDWDSALLGLFSAGVTVGMICEAKTGNYSRKELFPTAHTTYAVRRLGLLEDPSAVVEHLRKKAVVDTPEKIRITKLLISPDGEPSERFLAVSVDQVRAFLHRRISKYRKEKVRDRHFFDSELLQNMIDEIGQPAPVATHIR